MNLIIQTVIMKLIVLFVIPPAAAISQAARRAI